MVLRRRKTTKRKSMPKIKLNYARGTGSYRIAGRSKNDVLRKADKIDRLPGVLLSRPRITKLKYL